AHRLRHALGATHCRALLFQHRREHRFAGIHAQTEKRASHIIEDTRNRQRALALRIAYGSQFLLLRLRERLHFGGSFLCLLGPRMITCGRKEPPPSQTNRSTNSGTSPLLSAFLYTRKYTYSNAYATAVVIV